MLCCTVQRYLPGVFHLATVGFTAIKYIPDDENTPAEAWIMMVIDACAGQLMTDSSSFTVEFDRTDAMSPPISIFN